MTERPFDLNIEEVLESWETKHGIRELVANAIDEQVLSNTQEVRIEPIGPQKWRIRDFGRGLAAKHLTQKENPEKLANPDKVIGKFGVGLKDALGVLYRRGVKVEIVSRHAAFRVEMRPKIGFQGTRTLHAVVSPPPDTRFVGTELTLTGATQADVEGAKACFLRFSDEIELEATRYGQVLTRKPGRKARIYITGVLVAEDEGFLFSYNVAEPTKAMRDALNRERNNVGRTAFQQRVRDILLKCRSNRVGDTLASALEHSGPGRDELGWIDVAQHAAKFLNRSNVVMATVEQLLESPNLIEDAVRDGYRLVTIDAALAAKLNGMGDVDGNRIRNLEGFADDRAKSFEFDWVDDGKLSTREKLSLIRGTQLRDSSAAFRGA
jgi:hypothetical protein